MTTTPFQLGSISTSQKTEDLLPTLTRCLQTLSPSGELVSEAFEHMATWGGPDYAEETVEAASLLEEIHDALNDLCPPFVYFGPNSDVPCVECKGVKGDRAGICRTCNGSGDGSNFGFWPDWDGLADRCPTEASYYANGEYYLVECIVRFNGPYHVTVMNLDHTVLWSTV